MWDISHLSSSTVFYNKNSCDVSYYSVEDYISFWCKRQESSLKSISDFGTMKSLLISRSKLIAKLISIALEFGFFNHKLLEIFNICSTSLGFKTKSQHNQGKSENVFLWALHFSFLVALFLAETPFLFSFVLYGP